MLLRDSEALAQFRVDHRIPDDVVIERPSPNDDADWVEGEGNRMPIRPWFIYQAGLRFPLSKLLRTVLSICGLTFMQISVNFVRTVLVVEALMQREGLEFTAEDLFHPNQPQTRLVTDSPDKDQYLNDFIWVSGQWEFPADEPNLFSVPRHRGYVPDSTDASRGGVIDVQPRLAGRPILPPLQICGPGLRPRSSLSDKVSDLFEGNSAELRRLREEAEGKSSGSSESSSSSWDVDLGDEDLNEEAEVENGEEVDQVPTAVPLVPTPLVLIPKPINLPSSDSDIAIVESREIVEHSYSHSDSSSSRSQGNEEIMAPKVRILGKGQTPRIKPPMLPEAPDSFMPVTSVDTSKDHETCVALGNAVMLPQDVADHAAETTAEFGGKLVMLGAQLFQRAVSSSLQLKQGAVDLKKENEKANNLEKELKQTKSELADARSEAEIAILQRNQAQQLAELRLDVFQEGWLACMKELKIPLDHPAWLSPAPLVQLPASPERYSPINLPDFNEEEYATLPTDEGNIHTAVAEDRTGIEGTFGGDRATEAEGENLI
ncbi:hypothetical protein Acr_00g0005230 [Actinidia rufa]|uniref:Uncharacterized protein n=1 Tax=Actinidia rufa TaxID=165716 RepID=A0A7J0D9G8_9ERIC|nr:hypothetical protein Acr_00g0005230 [Actinidia rufa]